MVIVWRSLRRKPQAALLDFLLLASLDCKKLRVLRALRMTDRGGVRWYAFVTDDQWSPLQVCAFFGLVKCDSPTYPSPSKKRRKRLMEKQRSDSPSPARSKK